MNLKSTIGEREGGKNMSHALKLKLPPPYSLHPPRFKFVVFGNEQTCNEEYNGGKEELEIQATVNDSNINGFSSI